MGHEEGKTFRCTFTTTYPSPEKILAGEVRHDAVAEQSSVPRQRYTPRRKSGAGTGMVHGRPKAERGESRILSWQKGKAAELLQQLSGTPRFGKRRHHLQQV